jgi:uncharacterized NAD(P)/FAD-binding protein YdhS
MSIIMIDIIVFMALIAEDFALETRPSRPAQECSVAVIGGGFAGTTLAAQLLRHTDPSFSIVLVEKSGLPGRGVAYGTECNSHLLNVPANDMSAFPEDRDHFLRWAKSNYDPTTEACTFLPRKEYGRYLGAIFSEAVLSGGKRRLHWKRDEARSLSPSADGRTEILLRSSARILAERVVFALGNFPSRDPSLPGRESSSIRHPSNPYSSDPYFPNPWSDGSFDGADRLSSVLLLGSGLSSVDVAIQVRQRGFTGTIHILSRRGLLPRPHQAHHPWPIFWNEQSPKCMRGLLRLVRDQVREAEQHGIDWRGVITSLRPVTPQIWQALPETEKRRFMRHVQPYWEVHRHRAAPEIARFMDDQRSSGQIQLHAGRVTNYRENGQGVEITYRKRKSGEESCLSVDRIINCTAPETDCRCLRDPLLTSLLAQGLVRPDPLFLGLDTSADGALIDQEGIASDSLYAVGPARKGSLWESTAVPEIREQVYQLVRHLAKESGQSHPIGLDPRQESRQTTNV